MYAFGAMGDGGRFEFGNIAISRDEAGGIATITGNIYYYFYDTYSFRGYGFSVWWGGLILTTGEPT
jgi:hypothetical protein